LEEGKLEWDKPIYNYLKPSVFPVKTWKGKAVNITLRQVMSHTAGLRISNFPYDHNRVFYDRKNVTQALDQFKDEPLISEPGTQFHYSNYGFQVVGAIIESVMNETYESAITKVFKSMGLNETFPERFQKIYHHRARYYEKNETSNDVHNHAIWDDLVSHDMWWPAGGIMSTASDLLKYGNVMINSFKGRSQGGFLKQSTVKQLWTPRMGFSNDTTYGKRKL
jgi:serine beta-lactamase-like protein LACTB, mitochondrial